jgi:uncharacterized membrane protein YqjE
MSSTYGGDYGAGPPGGGPPEGSGFDQGGYDPGAPGGYDPSAAGGYDPSAAGGYDPSAPGGYDPGAPGGIPPAGAGYAETGGYVQEDYQTGYAEGTYQGATTAGGGATADTSYGQHGGASATGSARPDVEDESVGTLVGRLTTDASKLIRQELDLAKAELREEAKKAGKAAGMLGGAALAGLLVAILASFTLVWLLDNIMFLWLAGLIVTLLWGILGAVLFSMGRKRLAEVNPKPEQTVETLKEDKEWVQAQKS